MMAAPDSLKEVYTDEIKDLWSANDQMIKALTKLNEGVHDAKLKKHLTESLAGIGKHNEILMGLLKDRGKRLKKSTAREWKGSARRR